MERKLAEPTFFDIAAADLGGPRTQAFFDKCERLIPWKELAAALKDLYGDHEEGGRPPWPVELMVKCLMLQKWFGLSDPQLEEMLKDRLSFRRFVGLSLNDRTPDETTFVRFRARLREFELQLNVNARKSGLRNGRPACRPCGFGRTWPASSSSRAATSRSSDSCVN